MRSATRAGTARRAGKVPWADALLSAIAAVSWALAGMAGTAALGLHLLRADAAGSLGPMTAAVVALGAGGSVVPSGDVSAFGLKGEAAHAAIEITPLGVSLVGALLLSWFFLRSLRTAGVVITPAELLARAGTVVALFVALLGGLAWAGHDVITVDGGSLGTGGLLGTGGAGGKGGGGLTLPGIGDVDGLLPHGIGGLIHARAGVGFTVDTPATLLGGLGWCAGVLLLALLAARRAPLPPGWSAVHRVVRPAVSALVTVLLLTVAAGLAAAVYAAIGDDHPRRIAGAALLGTPNGVWLGLPLGLFVPWDGHATGLLRAFLPHPLDQFLDTTADRPVTLDRLAGLDGRVWLLGVAAALAMLLAGVLTAVRTPVARHSGEGHEVRAPGGAPGRGKTPPGGALGLAARCALRLAVVTALALPLLARLTDVSVTASLSVLGFDAFGAGITLHGHLGAALLLGAAWGAGAGATGALLAWGAGAAGSGAVWAARDVAGWGNGAQAGGGAGYDEEARPTGHGDGAGPYVPSVPYRPPNPDTNPYLRVPGEAGEEPQDARPPGAADDASRAGGGPPGAQGGTYGMYGAPTIDGPVGPAPPGSRRRPAPRPDGSSPGPERTQWPPPPPPPLPPPPPPGKPKRTG
ncbi:streptophobe family protein [Streptomyces sp. NPDC004232]|uniref:streptophobe family protein n=1 Tax=Streptomyces sp. NPDC004232 TaxID=3154454 RepID=UPI001D9D99E4|nr:streptophobe family protein [Streptomyces sp. tea 10]